MIALETEIISLSVIFPAVKVAVDTHCHYFASTAQQRPVSAIENYEIIVTLDFNGKVTEMTH